MHQVRAGAHRVHPVCRRVEAEVLHRHQLDVGAVDVAALVEHPGLLRHDDARHGRVLERAHRNHEPRDRAGQADLQQVLGEAGRLDLQRVVLVQGLHVHHVVAREQRLGGRGFVLRHRGPCLRPEAAGAAPVRVGQVLRADGVLAVELAQRRLELRAHVRVEVVGARRIGRIRPPQPVDLGVGEAGLVVGQHRCVDLGQAFLGLHLVGVLHGQLLSASRLPAMSVLMSWYWASLNSPRLSR